MHNDGTGSALYVGGYFTRIGNPPPGSTLPPAVRTVAKRGVAAWEALLPGLGTTHGLQPGRVNALATYNGELIAGGEFQQLYTGPGQPQTNPEFYLRNVARWNGTQWLPAGDGISTFVVPSNGAGVYAMHVHDDGSGPKLYVGGEFTNVGPMFSSGLARWNGTDWDSINPGNSAQLRVIAMATFDDDGPGPNPPYLYVGGSFDHFNGVEAHSLVRWDGVSWSAVPGWAPDQIPTVNALTVFDDDGAGPNPPRLFIGGHIDNWIAQPQQSGFEDVAVWDGTQISFPVGLPFGIGSGAFVTAMTVGHEGSRPVLYLGTEHWTFQGYAGFVQGMPYSLVRYDGHTTSTLGGGVYGPLPAECCDFPIFAGVYALTEVPTRNGPGLFVGGSFSHLDGGATTAKNMAVWTPARSADFNGVDGLTVQDIFDFLNAWFAGDSATDVNNADGVTVQDIFDFLNIWFAGC